MSKLQFLDFDVLFQRTEVGYRSLVLNSPVGQATMDFTIPFSEGELETFLTHFGQSRRPVRRSGKKFDYAANFGRRLFEAAFAEKVQRCLWRSLDEADRQGAGLRIRLRLGDTPELNDLPWEFLFNPLKDNFFALSRRTPIVRYLDLPDRAEPLKVKLPLRVLAIISSPGNHPPLDVESEWEKLQKALRRVVDKNQLILERLGDSTLKALQHKLRENEFHIIHFIGHG